MTRKSLRIGSGKPAVPPEGPEAATLTLPSGSNTFCGHARHLQTLGSGPTPGSMMSTTKSYLQRGAVTLALVTVFGYLATYVFNLGLARFLDPHAYGDFKVAYAFAHLLAFTALLGGDRAAPMVLAPLMERGERQKVGEYLRFYMEKALLLIAGLAAVVWTASWLHVGSSDPEHHHALAWVLPAIPLMAAGALVSRTLQSARRPAQAALPWRIGLPLLELGLFALVVVLLGKVNVVQAIAISAAAVAVVTGGQWWWIRRLALVDLKRDPSLREPRQWLTHSVPMMGAFLVALGLSQSDLYFLEMLGDEAEVGQYGAASTAAHLVILVQTTVIGLVSPLARPAIDKGAEESRAVFRQSHRLMLGGLIPVAVILILAAAPVLGLFGAQYRDAHLVLQLLVFGNFAWAAAALTALWLQFGGQGKAVLALSAAVLVADSGFNLLLIPRYGMDGAAASTAATLTAAAISLAVVLMRRGPEGGRG